MSNILYVSRSGLPKDAPSLRVDRLARLLQSVGYDVTIMSSRTDEQSVPISEHKQNDYKVVENGVVYLFPYRRVCRWYSKYLSFYELMFASTLYHRIVSYCNKNKPTAIILYNDIYFLTKRLLNYCKRNHISLFADVTEWYEKKSIAASLSSRVVPILVNKRITTLDHKLDGVIAISPYLYDYYSARISNVVFIPPLMPIEQFVPYDTKELRSLVYAGSPGDKDILLPLLEAYYLVNSTGVKIGLNLIGLNEQDIKNSWRDISLDKYGIRCFGRLPHNETLKVIRSSEFGVLLRHDLRYAKAGFSTKFAECLSLSVPMICNLVGGCDMLITNNKDGLLLNNINVATIVDCLEKIIKLPEDEYIDMKKCAFKKAHELFDYINYQRKLKEFIDYEGTH